MGLPIIYLIVLLVCAGYGITFSLFAVLVEASGASGFWIGVNAALPALGWIIGSCLVPVFQIRLQWHIKKVTLTFLVVAIFGSLIPYLSTGFEAMCATRFVFGGALGVFLRCVEYILVSNTSNESRGKYLAVYGMTFLTGIVLGSIVQPELASTPLSLGTALAAFLTSMALLSRADVPDQLFDLQAVPLASIKVVTVAPIMFLAVFIYAMYESVPAYFLQVFSLRLGMPEHISSYTLSAAAIGSLTLALPILFLSDRYGRLPLLMLCALVAMLVPFGVLKNLNNVSVYLALVTILGGFAGTSYGLSLAMLGDRFNGTLLVLANSVFGAVYATGSIVGPVIHGVAMEQSTQGLMYSLSAAFSILLVSALLITLTSLRDVFR